MQQPIWHSAEKWDELSGGLQLFRGFSQRENAPVKYIESPSNRLPKNMPPDVQALMDDWFYRKFGMRFREKSIFATGDVSIAQSYAGSWGQVRQLKPIADFCFCWSAESQDLYGEFESLASTESVAALLERLNFQCNELEAAIRSNCEIMLVCPTVKATLITCT